VVDKARVLEKVVEMVILTDRAKALKAVKVVVRVKAKAKDKEKAMVAKAKVVENPMFVVIVVAQVKKLLLMPHLLKIANPPFKKKPRNKPKRISVLNKKNAAKSVKRLPTKPKSKPKPAILKKPPIRPVKPKNVAILILKKIKIT
jgi:hypothetical protein